MSETFKDRLTADFSVVLFNAGVTLPETGEPDDQWKELVADLVDAAVNRAGKHIYELRRTL